MLGTVHMMKFVVTPCILLRVSQLRHLLQPVRHLFFREIAVYAGFCPHPVTVGYNRS